MAGSLAREGPGATLAKTRDCAGAKRAIRANARLAPMRGPAAPKRDTMAFQCLWRAKYPVWATETFTLLLVGPTSGRVNDGDRDAYLLSSGRYRYSSGL